MSVEQSPNQPRSVPNPKDILALKDSVLVSWEQLPPEHQATMTLLILQRTLGGEYAPWLKGALEMAGSPVLLRVEPKPQEETPGVFHIPFVKTTITRQDVANAIGESDAQRLTDDDMRYIATRLGESEENMWDDLEYFARRTLEEKPLSP